MSVWLAGAAVVGVATTAYSANKSAKAAKSAGQAQSDAAQAGIEEERRQFDAMRELLSPYVDAGKPALQMQQDIIGLNGNDWQARRIMELETSPMYSQMAAQGENAILQNASATGGLRGGNTQGALAQFRPQLLNQLIDQQYSRLGGMAQLGQNSAVGVGNAGMQSGANVASLLGQQGGAQAGAAIAQGKAYGQMAQGVSNAFGSFVGAKF